MAVATTNTQFSGDGWQFAAAGVNTTTPFQVSIGADLTLKWRYALAASAPAPGEPLGQVGRGHGRRHPGRHEHGRDERRHGP